MTSRNTRERAIRGHVSGRLIFGEPTRQNVESRTVIRTQVAEGPAIKFAKHLSVELAQAVG